MTRRMARAALALAIVLSARGGLGAQSNVPHPAPQSASARADSALDAETRSLASQLRCPVCQGLSVQDSPSELAQQMRDVVRQQLRDGKSADEVKDYFVARYGQWILMAPPAAGFNWLVYSLPGIVLAIGVVFLVVLVRRWTRSSRESALHPEANASHTMR